MFFYYGAISPNARRALAAAYQLGFEPELKSVEFFSPSFDEKAFEKLNPNGLVPILDDDGYLLWESNAIMQYLADKKGETPLFPRDPKTRADIARWQFWTLAHFEPAAGTLLWENSFKKVLAGGETDPAEVARGMGEFRGVARILEGHLSGREYLVGKQLTLADFSVAAFLMYAREAKLPLGEFRNLSAWLERVEATPGWTRSGTVITGFRKK